MKKAAYISVITILIMLLMLGGCSTRINYRYKGESELWSAEYTLTGTSTSTHESDYTTILSITYKRDLSELAKIKTIKIEYNCGSNSGSSYENYNTINPLNQKTIILKSRCGGTSAPQEDEIVTVKVTLDDKEQTMELKSVN